jgi:hypothetical protein
MSFLIRFLLLCLMPMAGWAQSSLPPCPADTQGRWHNCYGTDTFPNRFSYWGEFKDGKADGQGTYIFLADGPNKGAWYAGEFKGGVYNGRGTFTFSDGSKYVGEYKDNKRNGQGTLTYANGSPPLEGIWADDKFVRAEKISQPSPSNLAVQQEQQRLEAERRRQEQERLAIAEAAKVLAEERKRFEEQQLALQNASQPAAVPPPSAVTIRSAHALVIGNAAYPGSGRLDNPVNDANAMSQKLRSMGFTVTTVTDANRQRLVQAMAQFRRSAASADLSLLFYSGHGVQIFGTNYILPTDVDQTDTAQATIQGVRLNEVIENFMPGKTKIVFLDACRDNPLQRTGDRSVTKGLAPISVAEGTLISYATKDGQVAADGVGSKNSPFTQALLEHLADPQDIGVVLRKVREKVMRATGGKQQPWDYGSLTGGELVLSQIKGRRP